MGPRHFGAILAEKQAELRARMQAKAPKKSLKKSTRKAPRIVYGDSALEAAVGNKRYVHIRAQERTRYAQAKALTLQEQKAEESRVKAERKAAREAKRQAKRQALWLEEQQGTFKALNLNTPAEQSAFMKVRDILPPVLVSRLEQGGFVKPESVSDAIEFLRIAGANQLV